MIVSLIALGYTLVYGILQLINFANGDVFMLGSVITLIGVQIAGLQSNSPASSVLITFVILLPVTMLLMAGLNASIERIAYRPLRRAPTLATLHLRHRHVVHPPERRPEAHRAVPGLAAEPPAEQQHHRRWRAHRDRHAGDQRRTNEGTTT